MLPLFKRIAELWDEDSAVLESDGKPSHLKSATVSHRPMRYNLVGWKGISLVRARFPPRPAKCTVLPKDC